MDIVPSETELLSAMKPKTRYNIRLAEKHGVSVRFSREARDMETFINLIYATTERKAIRPHPWKTTNSGTTFAPIFDSYGSYSMGALTMDPSNHSVLWLGTGENNNQRSVAYGDGIYKSEDAGKTWKNMGFKNSEHIGQIVVDPKNSDFVYVAAYGPLWACGGERGIYKTTDGGKNWSRILHVSDHTGFNEIHRDPRDNKVLFACAHQRQRKIFTYIGG